MRRIQDLSEKLDKCETNLKTQITINEELEEKVNSWQARGNDLSKKLSETMGRLENIEKVIENATAVIKNVILVSHGRRYGQVGRWLMFLNHYFLLAITWHIK